ncbi:MAG: hypothetical protein AAF950_07095 [Pseudomonadota bacterium]
MSKKSSTIATVHENLAGIRDDVQAMNAALAAARPMIQEVTTLLASIAAMQDPATASKEAKH